MSIKLRNVQSLEDVAGLVAACAITVLAVIIVTALYVGREIFVPMALAILLSFVLAAPVNLLQSLRVPRALAAIVTVLLAFIVIFALGSLIATQLTKLAGDLPQYQSTIQSKIASLRGVSGSSSTLERAEGMLQELGKELNKPKGSDSSILVTAPRPGASSSRTITLFRSRSCSLTRARWQTCGLSSRPWSPLLRRRASSSSSSSSFFFNGKIFATG